MTDATTDRYCVMGNPVSHSLSPSIHTAFAAETGEQLQYSALEAPLDGFKQALADFFGQGGRGCNITVPFKQEAWAAAGQRSRRAEKAGAANTLWRDEKGVLHADNTDGAGLVRDLVQNHAYELAGKNILMLGAGGAVRGVLQPLLAEQPGSIVIANRTVSKAATLAELFADEGCLEACGFEQLDGRHFDLIINGTAASLQGELPPLADGLLNQGAWTYDMMYHRDATPFQRWSYSQQAAQALDGLGMLVEQAAESFTIWRGVRPQTQPVISALRDSLKQS